MFRPWLIRQGEWHLFPEHVALCEGFSWIAFISSCTCLVFDRCHSGCCVTRRFWRVSWPTKGLQTWTMQKIHYFGARNPRSDGIMEFNFQWLNIFQTWQKQFFSQRNPCTCVFHWSIPSFHTQPEVWVIFELNQSYVIGSPAHTRSEKLSPRRKPLKGPATRQQRKATTSTLGESYNANVQ